MNFECMKQRLIAAAERAGLKEYEIYAMSESNVNAEALRHEISAFSSGESGGISFRCIVDGKMGYASSELMTEEQMDALVDRAIDNARNIENEDEVFIFPGSAHYEETSSAPVATPEAAVLKNWTMDLQERAYAAHPSVSDGTQTGVMAYSCDIMLCNSHGLSLSNRVGVCGAYTMAIIREGDATEDSFELRVTDDASALDGLSEKAVEKARAKLGAGKMPSGKMDCVISGRQMSTLLSAFSPMFSAKMVQHGMSTLGGKLGEKIAADCVTITDDPRRAECPIQTSFDGEGVATYRKSVIEGGVLKTYLYDLTTAKKDGVSSTGNGQRGSYSSPVSIAPYCFCLEAGKESQEELFAKVDNGVYITELKGVHAGANAITGDFSLEAAGFRIRDGKKAEPVKTFTIAGNFLELLKAVEEVSDTVDFGFPGGFTAFASADVLLRGVSVAGE